MSWDDEYKTSWNLSQLVIYVQIILIPAYFLVLGNYLASRVLLPFLAPEHSTLLTQWVGPILFALPLVVWSIAKRYQLSASYELMAGKVQSLPIAIRAFYGLNFVIALLFLFPFVAPLIGVLGGYWLALILVNRTGEDKGIGFRNNKMVKFLTLSYGIFAGILALAYYLQIIPFFQAIADLWTTNIDLIYNLCVSLADAVTFGAILLFYFEFKMDEEKIPDKLVLFISLGLYAIFATAILIATDLTFMTFIHYIAIAMAVLMITGRFALGMTDTKNSDIRQWITIAVFQLINLMSAQFALFTRTTAIGIAFLLFSFFFYFAYREACKRY